MQINLAEKTYQRLLKLVTSFEDQPEDVIIRLLDESEGGDGMTESPSPPPSRPSGPSRAAPGSVLPVKEYWVPILQVLEDMEGSAPSNDVIDALEKRMKDVFTQRDFERLKSGEIRWRNRARFARLRMKEQGLISDSSHRGVWAITSLGSAYLRLNSKDPQ
jgi:hypothetical protein